jgi:hypothetical protein
MGRRLLPEWPPRFRLGQQRRRRSGTWATGHPDVMFEVVTCPEFLLHLEISKLTEKGLIGKMLKGYFVIDAEKTGHALDYPKPIREHVGGTRAEQFVDFVLELAIRVLGTHLNELAACRCGTNQKERRECNGFRHDSSESQAHQVFDFPAS